MVETYVSFRCDDPAVSRLYEEAERKARLNLRSFGGETVLVEGGGYNKIWLETQPMGGEMYALRNLEAARNNTLLFMKHQRQDGRLPGSIRADGDRVVPEYNKYQGFCFPFPALNLYYLSGEDPADLQALEECLVRFDEHLHKTRELKGDGLLYSFCVYDTGEDGAVRYGDAPCWWTSDEPPKGYEVVPMASMDITSWSYACRAALEKICAVRGDNRAEYWAKKAAETAAALRRGLWNERRGALFDRDRLGRPSEILCHNTLRCMYWGSVSRDMADRFVREHLLNPDEFMTPFPLPSVAANDPAFRNLPENNWSGQPEGLTYQRAILALENYGYDSLVTLLGRKLSDTVSGNGYRFTQQFDPFTGKPSLVDAATKQPADPSDGDAVLQDAYGPTVLSVLEYTAHRWGVHPHLADIWFSLGSGLSYQYEAGFRGLRCRIDSDGSRARILLDGRTIHEGPCGVRVVAGTDGTIRAVRPIEGPPGVPVSPPRFP